MTFSFKRFRASTSNHVAYLNKASCLLLLCVMFIQISYSSNLDINLFFAMCDCDKWNSPKIKKNCKVQCIKISWLARHHYHHCLYSVIYQISNLNYFLSLSSKHQITLYFRQKNWWCKAECCVWLYVAIPTTTRLLIKMTQSLQLNKFRWSKSIIKIFFCFTRATHSFESHYTGGTINYCVFFLFSPHQNYSFIYLWLLWTLSFTFVPLLARRFLSHSALPSRRS